MTGAGTEILHNCRTCLSEFIRIDSFLDASLVFARDSQIYLLALTSKAMSTEIHSNMRDTFEVYLAGINRALSPDRKFIVGNGITLADICFVAEIGLFHNERARVGEIEKLGLEPILNSRIDAAYPRAMAHFETLSNHSAFAPDVLPYLEKIEGLPKPIRKRGRREYCNG